MANVTTAPACLECDTGIAVPVETELGDILSCRGCGQEHERNQTGRVHDRLSLMMKTPASPALVG